MKQIYNFDKGAPPMINESMIRAEIERRQLQRETSLLSIASLLILGCLFLAALQLYETIPLLSFACAAYICIAVTGGSVIALVYTQKRRSLTQCIQQP